MGRVIETGRTLTLAVVLLKDESWDFAVIPHLVMIGGLRPKNGRCSRNQEQPNMAKMSKLYEPYPAVSAALDSVENNISEHAFLLLRDSAVPEFPRVAVRQAQLRKISGTPLAAYNSFHLLIRVSLMDTICCV